MGSGAAYRGMYCWSSQSTGNSRGSQVSSRSLKGASSAATMAGYVDDSLTVLLTRPDDNRKNPHIVAGGQVRLPNGAIYDVGGAPKF